MYSIFVFSASHKMVKIILFSIKKNQQYKRKYSVDPCSQKSKSEQSENIALKQPYKHMLSRPQFTTLKIHQDSDTAELNSENLVTKYAHCKKKTINIAIRTPLKQDHSSV